MRPMEVTEQFKWKKSNKLLTNCSEKRREEIVSYLPFKMAACICYKEGIKSGGTSKFFRGQKQFKWEKSNKLAVKKGARKLVHTFLSRLLFAFVV